MAASKDGGAASGGVEGEALDGLATGNKNKWGEEARFSTLVCPEAGGIGRRESRSAGYPVFF
jgi:hypothetical protein